MASKSQKNLSRKKKKSAKKSPDELAFEHTLKVGVDLDEDNISSSSSLSQSDTESATPHEISKTAHQRQIRRYRRRKAGAGAKCQSLESSTRLVRRQESDDKVSDSMKGESSHRDMIEIPQVEIETEENPESSSSAEAETAKADSKLAKGNTRSSDTLKPSTAKKAVPLSKVGTSKSKANLHSDSSTSSMASPNNPPEEAQPQSAAMKSMADVAVAAVQRPKLSGENLPKMADFLPDIRAKIEMLKKPSKNKGNKKKNSEEQADDANNTGGEGEIYGEYRGPNKPKKVLFGIGKNGVERALVRFHEKPESRPLDVYFDFPNSSLSHSYVYNNVKQQIMNVEGAKITGIQYQDRNVLFGARTVENRWIISVNNVDCRDELIKLGLVIFNRKVKVRKYDEALEEDFNDFLKNSKLAKHMLHLQGEGGEAQPAGKPPVTGRRRGGSVYQT